MFLWLFFVESNEEFHKFLNFYEISFLNSNKVSGISYLIFDDDVKCTDGRVFQGNNNIIIAVRFTTLYVDPRKLLIDFGLNPASLISYDDIVCDDNDDPYRRRDEIWERSKFIVRESDLVEYLEEKQFKFKDKSKPTIPDSDFYARE
ncbi:MAG: hypothetical protein KGD58_09255 [Candidatus Lokiarchaeota archaeon]|nr:hypothetical protein [Candidatus Lokiarchaeota archaeon]